jgi:hypothetical protein
VLNLALAPLGVVNGTLVEDKMRRFKGKCAHFSFNTCGIYTHDKEIQKGSIAKSYMTDGLLKYG